MTFYTLDWWLFMHFIMDLKKFPLITLNRIIDKAKNKLKSDPVMIDMFKEHGIDIEEMQYFPTYFADLDVSAKTDHGIVYLNYKLLDDGFSEKNYSYLIHEYRHVLQQTAGTKPTKSSDDGEYLDNEFEQEAFQDQVEYLSNEFGKDHAEEYVDDLLDHHEITNKKEIKEKKNILMENVLASLKL